MNNLNCNVFQKTKTLVVSAADWPYAVKVRKNAEKEVGKIQLRTLLPKDAEAYRVLRLEALKNDGRFFPSSYENEISQFLPVWQMLCTASSRRCVLGLFDQGALVATTSVSPWPEDTSGRTAIFGPSYVTPSHRGLGLGLKLCKARLEWARTNKIYQTALAFHRDGNLLSESLLHRFCARYWQSREMQWADGQTAYAHWYQVDLSQTKLT